VPSLAALVLLVVANNNSGNVALAAIGSAFHAGPADVGWVAFGYTAMFAVATATWGSIGRVYGTGRSLAVAASLLAAGSAFAVVAPSLPALVVARLIQGAGAGAVPTLAATIVVDVFHGPRRSQAMGAVFAGMGAGLAIGPLLGAVALELDQWRAAISLGVLALPLAWVANRIPSPTGGPLPGWRSVLATGGVCLATIFLANRIFVVGEPVVLAAAAGVLGISLLALLRYPGARSIVPRTTLASGHFGLPAIAGATGMGSFVGLLVVAPLAQATQHQVDGLELGMLLLPLAVVSALTSYRAGALTRRFGSWSVVAIGLLALEVSTIALAGAPNATPAVVATLLVPAGLGFGLIRAPLLSLATAAGDPQVQASLAGAHNLTFFLGGAVGAAIGTGAMQGALVAPFGGASPVAAATTLLAALPAAGLAAVAVTRLRPKARGS
jgi:MFS family permease